MRLSSKVQLILALAAGVGAFPLDRRDVTPQQLSSLELFSQYAAISYCNSGNAPGQAITCNTDNCPLVRADGAVTHVGFATPILDTRGLIAIDPVRSLIVVSFRGSASVRNWITDASFAQIPCTLGTGCLVHAGFASAWSEVSAVVLTGVASARAANPTYSVISTGHSLGGAVATLAAAYLREAGHPTDLYTYGSPRVGNFVFAEYVTETQGGLGAEYRVTHTDDPVPKLPPIATNYRHLSPEYWINTDTDAVAASQIEVCTGYATLGCNAGTLGANATAHVWYFGPISGCGPDELILPFEVRNT
ncbi:Alpha/Beta hydrolase protein [Rhypophila decipiens]|uniref:Alpha/Beta hydrolase protein n=1 Tax=Rhypophila decipiens TaxID=261697 RepID=A0AAN7BBU7_9PEZI|nr:Alpha/Beta hydrolase protein [Rhypophila decipiens]